MTLRTPWMMTLIQPRLGALFALSSHINIFYNNHKESVGISKSTYERLTITFAAFISEVLGLRNEAALQDNYAMDAVMNLVIELRNEARKEKNWPVSDKIRDQLKSANILLKDNKDGSTTYEIG